MPGSISRRVKPLLIVALMVVLALPSSLTAYNVTTFSDSAAEKTLIFTDLVNDGTALLSIPRATNLSEASISLAGSASIVGDLK